MSTIPELDYEKKYRKPTRYETVNEYEEFELDKKLGRNLHDIQVNEELVTQLYEFYKSKESRRNTLHEYILSHYSHQKYLYDLFEQLIEDKKTTKHSKLPSILSSIALSSLVIGSVIGLASPYNIITAIALSGPLFVSLYSLKK